MTTALYVTYFIIAVYFGRRWGGKMYRVDKKNPDGIVQSIPAYIAMGYIGGSIWPLVGGVLTIVRTVQVLQRWRCRLGQKKRLQILGQRAARLLIDLPKEEK